MKKWLCLLLAAVVLLSMTACGKERDVFADLAEGDLLYDIGATSLDCVESFTGREELYAQWISFDEEEVKLFANYTFRENLPADLLDDLFLFPTTKQMEISVNGNRFSVCLLEDCRIVVSMPDGRKIYGAEEAELFTQDMFYGLVDKYASQTEATQSTTAREKPIPGTGHTYTLLPASEDANAKYLTVKITGEETQSILLKDKEWFIPEPILIDITFDGHTDILIPAQRTSGGAFFTGYIWDANAGQYANAPTLENIPNIAVDAENQVLLGSRTASQITGYSMYRYNGDTRDFACVRSLYWEPGDGGVTVVERDDKETEINRFSATTADGLFPDKTDAKMIPYYEAGSLWDLDSGRWRNTVYTP